MEPAEVASSLSAVKPSLLENAEQRIRYLAQAREVIAAYITHYHHRPHSRLNYRTPSEVRQTWDDAQDQLQKQAA